MDSTTAPRPGRASGNTAPSAPVTGISLTEAFWRTRMAENVPALRETLAGSGGLGTDDRVNPQSLVGAPAEVPLPALEIVGPFSH